MTDQVVERARDGDVDAFVVLMEQRQGKMTRVASAILGNRNDAEDAIQETLVSIWRELPRLRQAAQFDAWADRILVNACRLVLRRRSRRSVREIAPIEGVGGDPAAPADIEPIAARDAFARAFEAIDPEARTLLVVRHLEDWPVSHIANALRIPEGTVKSRLFAARRALEAALEREAQ